MKSCTKKTKKAQQNSSNFNVDFTDKTNHQSCINLAPSLLTLFLCNLLRQ